MWRSLRLAFACALCFPIVLAAEPASPRIGINVQVHGPSYRSPNQTLDVGYEVTSQDFFGTIAGVQMYSDYTSFYLYDDWSGYGYWWAYHYTYDDDAASVGYTEIEYVASAWGYDLFGDPTSGYNTLTVYPESPYAYSLYWEGYADDSFNLGAYFCPECYIYDGKWWIYQVYHPMDQWGLQYYGSFRIDEDISSDYPASGSACGDTFSSHGETVTNRAFDSWKGCLSECQFDHFCGGLFWQGIFLNSVYLGSNLTEFDCWYAYMDYTPF